MLKLRWMFIFLLLPAISFSQNIKLTGKVINDKNEVLPGVSIKVIEGSSTTTDMDGMFSISLSTGKKHELVFTAVGYAAKTITDVEVSVNGLNELSVVMEVAAQDLQGVTVSARSNARRESVNSLISYQKNTTTVASVISAEAIRRSPDRNTGEVLKRVPGTSIQEGKYLVVRGLADRYNQAMLNGILLGSTEPDRKTFSFDLFPSAMIDNIIINKAFLPELPGEWAGGLVQVQTKEIPTKDFLSIQIGTGFNSNTIGKDFLQYSGGKLDWLGIADESRALPGGIPSKTAFKSLNQEERNAYGKLFRNEWQATGGSAPLNSSFQLNSGFTGNLFKKKVGGVLSLIYNQSNRKMPFENAVIANNEGDYELYYHNDRYTRDVLAGALANFSIQFNNNHRVSLKNVLNVNSSDFVIDRFDGTDNILMEKTKAQELGFRQNTFLNSQLTGEHNFPGAKIRGRWYGGFNILDQYIPDLRRLFYTKDPNDPAAIFEAQIGLAQSQKSGVIFYSNLNDYIYNIGGDASKTFDLFGRKQTIKAGYLFQVKDRLFDSRPFYLQTSSTELKRLPADQIFAAENFGNDPSNSIQIDQFTGPAFRYMANTILNAGFLQFDNEFSSEWRLTWGARVEDYDQLVGSIKKSDPRHSHSRVRDILPGFNLTYKPTAKTNIRLSGSQTVVRPEFRELSPFAFYDFELNAQVVGNSGIERSKIANADLRYEIYPGGGEVITAGVFYKYFNKPIEYYFNRTGPATNTFNVQNSDHATTLGAELEFRKKLDFINEGLQNFTLTGNYSYIYSRVKDTTGLDRPLQGQSPYLVNGGLQYDNEKLGFAANLLYNRIGRRILFVGNEAVSDIWEQPRSLVDLQLSKKILKEKGELKLNISDLLNQRAYFYHDLDGNETYKNGSGDRVAISRNYGSNYSISFNYTIK